MNGVSIGNRDSPSFHSVVKHLQPDEFANDRDLLSTGSAGNPERGLREDGGRPVVFRFDGVNEGQNSVVSSVRFAVLVPVDEILDHVGVIDESIRWGDARNDFSSSGR